MEVVAVLIKMVNGLWALIALLNGEVMNPWFYPEIGLPGELRDLLLYIQYIRN